MNRDDAATVQELKNLVDDFVAERDWNQFHNPKNLVISLSIECGELMEHFQWLTPEESDQLMRSPQSAQAIGEEVADCLAYLLALANRLDIDLASALADKMVKNAEKYPVESCRGVARPNLSSSTGS